MVINPSDDDDDDCNDNHLLMFINEHWIEWPSSHGQYFLFQKSSTFNDEIFIFFCAICRHIGGPVC